MESRFFLIHENEKRAIKKEEGDNRRWRGRRQRNGGSEYDQSTLYTCMKCK
jgi:hypothetical protein